MRTRKTCLVVSVLALVPLLIIDSFFKDIVSKNLITFTLVLLFFILVKVYCFEVGNRMYNEEATNNIIIVAASYYIITYLVGLSSGFYKNPNGLTFISVTKNILQESLYILACEMFRYIVTIKSQKNKIILSILVILLSLCDTSDMIYKNNFLDISDTIELVGYQVLPSILKNILLTYLAIKTGYSITILYRGIFELPYYFVPIIPNLGLYVNTILNIIIPILLFLWFYHYFHKKKKLTFYENKLATFTINIISSTLALCLIFLTSGIFKYYAVTIGSESMTPVICKGDAVIVKKLDIDEVKNLKEGEILVYKNSNMIIVHRITKIFLRENKYYFCTKGDFNNAIDSYVTVQEDVIGVVKYKVPWIGLPTVWLKNLANF